MTWVRVWPECDPRSRGRRAADLLVGVFAGGGVTFAFWPPWEATVLQAATTFAGLITTFWLAYNAAFALGRAVGRREAETEHAARPLGWGTDGQWRRQRP